MKGSRVQGVIRELHGEKIDIIPYSEDPITFVTNALSPAKIDRASIIDPMEKHLEVIVEMDQLSLAIGKKGQNVRLAAKLTGWKIDIKSDEEKRAEIEDQMALLEAKTPLSELPGLSKGILEKLTENSIKTIEELAANVLIGTADEVNEKIQVYSNLGIDELICNLNFGLPQKEAMAAMERMVTDVIPNFSQMQSN